MDSPQSVVSPFKSSLIVSQPEKKKSVDPHRKEDIGVLNVFLHQARDIHNICIYHKQDVYAKLCLTSDPENSVSSKIINGGGQNPVFNDNLIIHVKTIDSSLKCEIYMMSRVKNYLEDQLLGFALVPLSDLVIKNNRLEKEFTLSSTDLFHSPAGFVHLSLSYSGASPDVMTVQSFPTFSEIETDVRITNSKSITSEFNQMEFPDPKIVNENEMMVSEYLRTTCTEQSEPEALITKLDSPPSCVSSEAVLDLKESEDDESNSSNGVASHEIQKSVISVNVEPEQTVVQQDIIDMYMKSMQQFTDSLAKMKLPLDTETGPASSVDSSSDQKSQGPKTPASRVFYGSRAFF